MTPAPKHKIKEENNVLLSSNVLQKKEKEKHGPENHEGYISIWSNFDRNI